MAVTRTTTELAADLRVGDGATAPTGALAKVLDRVSATARAAVEHAAPNAPEAIQNEAYTRLAAYLYDSDPAGRSPGGPNALRVSGALALLQPYIGRRGVQVSGQAAAPGSGSAPSSDVAVLAARVLALEAALAGGATGQVLAKQSSVDRVFAWVANTVAAGGVTVAKLAADVLARILPTPSQADAGKVATVRSSGAGYELTDPEGLTADERLQLEAAFVGTWDDSVARTFVVALSNANGEAVFTEPTGVDQDREVGIDINDADGQDRSPWIGAIGVGDWVYIVRGAATLLFKVEAASTSSGVRKLLYTAANASTTGNWPSDNTLAGAATIYATDRDLSGFVKTDGSNVTSAVVEAIQGTNEPKTFTGYTRVAALTGAGEWNWSGVAGDSFQLVAKSGELSELRKRVKVGHFLRFASGLEIVVTGTVTTFGLGAFTVLQFTAAKVAGNVPALASTSVLTTLGDDIHRKEVSKAALKATLPAAGKYLRVTSNGQDVEGADISGSGALVAGDGLGASGNTWSVNVGNGTEINNDKVVVKLDGTTLSRSNNGLKVADGGVDSTQLAADAVTSAKIAADAVTAAKMADDAVETDAVKDGAVTSAKLAADAVTAAKMADDAVETDAVKDAAITAAKLAPGVGGGAVGDNLLTADATLGASFYYTTFDTAAGETYLVNYYYLSGENRVYGCFLYHTSAAALIGGVVYVQRQTSGSNINKLRFHRTGSTAYYLSDIRKVTG